MKLFKRKTSPAKFCGSTILGAKSLALQAGIPASRQPDYMAYVGGLWTIFYKTEKAA